MAGDHERLRDILVGGGKYDDAEFAALLAGWDRRTPIVEHLLAARALDKVGARTVEAVLKGYVTLPRGVLLALFAPPVRTGAQVQERMGMSVQADAAASTRPRTPSREEVRAAVSAALGATGLGGADPEPEPSASASAIALAGLRERDAVASATRGEASEPRRQAGGGPRRRRVTSGSFPAVGQSDGAGPQRQGLSDMSGEWRTGDGVRTLAEAVALAGPLDAVAVARIGSDLAWDLWAAGGHGDVRAGRVLVAGVGQALGARLAGPRRGGAVREDMQALGATLFYAATGREPPPGRGQAAIELARLPGFSPAVAQVITGLLRGRADARPEAWESVIAALRTALPAE